MATPSGPSCLEKALGLLSRRPHFRGELTRKLRDRGFDPGEVDAVVSELERRGLIDDRRSAMELAGGSLRRKGYGPRRIRAELLRRGVEEGVAEAVAAEIFDAPGEELRRAREVVRRWRRATPGNGSRLARHLNRKGYSKRTIVEILGETEPD